ncbi:tail assembly chaperone [Mycobacterium phage Saguaro]|uniref:Tail assembly chaperone n=1 Tax=Mycobacterium phage Saguaro TaxID=2315616 RepID=A0A386KB57_9CAUD|nr:tail assembly chaperone [Mycobacterium phage Saguaro]AYD82022.1 hypothetical protein SEA_SAGUARO_27 [Mycobacterium phage Saguaro]
MTTFNAEGKSTDDAQLSPPASFDPDPSEVTPPPAPTDAERAELTANVKGTALTDTEREADYQAAHSRQEAGLPSQAGDVEKLANRPEQPEPEVIEETSTAVALAERFDVAVAGEQWPHDFLEFKGDRLGIRLPTRQALAAFSLASSKYVSPGVKNDLTGLFIARHLSPESYGRVFSRLMDPDENDYTVDTVGELFNAIVMAAVESDKASEKRDGAG